MKKVAPRTRVRNIVRELRSAAEMTQQELADQIGLTRQSVIAIEQGRYSPSLEAAFRIARALDIPLERAFWLEE